MTCICAQGTGTHKCCLCGKFSQRTMVQFRCCRALSCKKCYSMYVKTHLLCPMCGSSILDSNCMCVSHNKPYEYKCENCDVYLCSECLFDIHCNGNSEHMGHKICKISDLQNDAKNKINNELQCLREILKTIKEEIGKITQLRAEILCIKDMAFIDSNTSYRIFQKNLEEQYSSKQSILVCSLEKLDERMKGIQSLIDEGEILLTNSGTKELFENKFLDKIKSVLNSENNQPVNQPSPNFINELVPPFQFINFKINDIKKYQLEFKKCKIDDERAIYSQIFDVYGGKWRIKVYPNGNASGLNTHVSVYIELTKGFTSSSFVYKIEIESHNPNYSNITKQHTSTFEKVDSWGWNKLIPLETVYDGYIDDNNDISFNIGLRPKSYLVASRNSQEEYERITTKCKTLKHKRNSPPSETNTSD